MGNASLNNMKKSPLLTCANDHKCDLFNICILLVLLRLLSSSILCCMFLSICILDKILQNNSAFNFQAPRYQLITKFCVDKL